MRSKALYVLLAVQMLGLVLLYGYHQSGLGHPTFLLKTMPVDPRDLFRGDYIILSYEISRLPETYQPAQFQNTDRVYVSLKQENGFSVIEEVTSWEPADGRPFLQARLEGSRLLYDLENYFVPEGKGNPPGKLTVEIAVRPDGRCQIKQLFNDGHPWP